MTQSTICFIGAGNMATSLIGGLISSQYPAQSIIACDPNADRLTELQNQFNIRVSLDNNKSVEEADIVVLATKPQVLQTVCKSLKKSMPANPLVVSIAAGVRASDINHWLGGEIPIIRCMPNTPALINEGACALAANDFTNTEHRQSAENILNSTGMTVWVENEQQLDAVTAISGSGPAYFFLFIESLQDAGIELGLNPEVARNLAQQTAIGAAKMALGNDLVKLREQVTSKAGTTEQAIFSFEQQGLRQIVLNATQAAEKRSAELADELSNDQQEH